jgi:hypothetical protein
MNEYIDLVNKKEIGDHARFKALASSEEKKS